MMIKVLFFGAVLLGLTGGAWAVDPGNPDWPCIQHKVPIISAGMVWAGPPIAEQDKGWRDDEERLRLVQELAARRLPLAEAYERIDAYAAGLGDDKNQALGLLFTGLLQTINGERSEIMSGIERYARQQKTLGEQIQAGMSEMNRILNGEQLGDSEREQVGQLEQRLSWQSRIFDEREQSLTYVCESPVLLEQRLFALSRQLMGHLEE